MYCLLQKIKRSRELPVIERWEAYMLPNHSCFGALEEKHFLERTPLITPLEDINSNVFSKEFRKHCRRFLEDFVSNIVSAVADRSSVGHGLSFFCPKIVIAGDEYSIVHLFGQMLGGLIETGWVRGSKVELAKADFYSFVREQRQLEVNGSRSRVPINIVFAF